MARLAHKTVKHVIRAAIRSGLERDALSAGIDPEFWSGLPNCRTNTAQYLRDVYEMNAVRALPDGCDPLEVWLGNAIVMAGQRAEAQVFESALAERQGPWSDEGAERGERVRSWIRRWQRALLVGAALVVGLVVWVLLAGGSDWRCTITDSLEAGDGSPSCGSMDFEARVTYEVDFWATDPDAAGAGTSCQLALKVPQNRAEYGVYFIDQDDPDFSIPSHAESSPLAHEAEFRRSCAQCTHESHCHVMFAVCLRDARDRRDLDEMARLSVDIDGRPEVLECALP